MGEAARRKQLGLGSRQDDVVDRGPWLHGTHELFDHWLIPPPRNSENQRLMPHTASFFTKDIDFARGAGPLVCRASLAASASVLVAGVQSKGSARLRATLLAHKIARHSAWLHDEPTWLESWRTGNVMKFATTNEPLLQTLVGQQTDMIQRDNPQLPYEAAEVVAKHRITRGWIELLTTSAKSLGYDALQGMEVDTAPDRPPRARSWLAVFKAEVLSPPDWGAEQTHNLGHVGTR